MVNIFYAFDYSIWIAAFSNFCFFLVFHILLLRSKLQSTPRAIVCSAVLGLSGTVLSLSWFVTREMGLSLYSFWVILAASCSAILIYSLLVFHYLALIFGMGESAIRIRLLYELDHASSRGLTIDEIYNCYNAEKILEIRLERLVTTGHLTFDGKFWRISNPILLIQAYLTRILKCLMGITR